MAKTGFLKLVIVVIWSVTPIFYFFYLFSSLKKSLGFIFKKILILKHSVNLKNHINKSTNVRFPIRTMYN